MKRFPRFFSAVLCAFCVLYSFPAAQAQSVNETGEFHSAANVYEIQMRGIIRVGTAGDYCPMSFLNPETGKYEGFDADLAEDLAASLGVRLEYVATSWPTLMEDTLAGKFDLAICGITITEARLEKALMSDGYLVNGKTILIRAEDVDKYKTLADINRPEVLVMENPGGTNEKFARANLPRAKMIIHPVNEEIPTLIAEGKADVMITEMAEAGYYTKRDKRLAAPLITKPFSSGRIGVLMNKDAVELLHYVNSFLKKEETSGRLNDLRKKYIYNTDAVGASFPGEPAAASDSASKESVAVITVPFASTLVDDGTRDDEGYRPSGETISSAVFEMSEPLAVE